jgi:FkbM family methyltransferase
MYSKVVEMPIVQDVRVLVPDDIQLVTPYVLYEQQDWFEDEIKFLREMLQPGQHVIDIGANFGVYSLSLAKVVGPAGSVRAFEPTASTAALLEASVSLNGFQHVQVSRTALSNYSGTAQIAIASSPEMNALLSANEVSNLPVETVRVETLDALNAEGALNQVSFMKIDAEGHEANILKGGQAFFSIAAPLVMYEIIHSNGPRLDLVGMFSQMGYESYRLIPGLNVLVPFSIDDPLPPFLLNLFACKAATAERLASQGWLATKSALGMAERELNAPEVQQRFSQSIDWLEYLKPLPYAQFLQETWLKRVLDESEANNASLNLAMCLFVLSENTEQTAALRYLALVKAGDVFKRLAEAQPDALHLSSLARVQSSLGERLSAVAGLSRLYNKIHNEKHIDASIPFLGATECFSFRAVGSTFSNWLLSSIIDANERLQRFSSFYAGQEALPWLKTLHAYGHADAEMVRRLNLLSQKFEG